MNASRTVTMISVIGLVFLAGGWMLRDLAAQTQLVTGKTYEEMEIPTRNQDVELMNKNKRMCRFKASLINDRLERLEQKPADSSGERDDAPAAEEAEVTEGDACAKTDQSRRDLGSTPKERLNAFKSNFAAQTYDADWAPGASDILVVDLSSKAEDFGFELNAVECRHNGCRAIMAFENYKTAQENAQSIAKGRYSLPCVTGVSVPVPAQPLEGQPYVASVFFESCEKSTAILI